MRNIIKKVIHKISIIVRQYYYSIFPNMQCLKEIEKLNSLTIETVNICNANCIFCGYQHMKRKKQFMSKETFEKSIDDFVMAGGIFRYLSLLGSPL